MSQPRPQSRKRPPRLQHWQPPPTTTSTVLLGDPLAIISSSGVAVAVLQTLTDGYLVTTPCGNETTLTSGTPVHLVVVVLDPGHGGPIDTGAVGATGTPEKDVNLRVAKATEAMLLQLGIPTLMTARYPDTHDQVR